jgi:hypothetical protein
VTAVDERSQEPNFSNVPELAICSVLALLSLWGIIWYETSGRLKGDIDGLLLLSICLLIGGIFSVRFLRSYSDFGWTAGNGNAAGTLENHLLEVNNG